MPRLLSMDLKRMMKMMVNQAKMFVPALSSLFISLCFQESI